MIKLGTGTFSALLALETRTLSKAAEFNIIFNNTEDHGSDWGYWLKEPRLIVTDAGDGVAADHTDICSHWLAPTALVTRATDCA